MFLKLCEANQQEVLNKIITGDEAWVHYCDPESKQESIQWHVKGTPAPKMLKTVPCAGNIRPTILGIQKGSF